MPRLSASHSMRLAALCAGIAALAALSLAGTASARPLALAPVASTGYSSMMVSFAAKSRSFTPLVTSPLVWMSTKNDTSYVVTVKKADGTLWWKASGKIGTYEQKRVAWAGRSSNGKGSAPQGVYNVRVVVIDTTDPDPDYVKEHTFTANWQVRVLPRKA